MLIQQSNPHSVYATERDYLENEQLNSQQPSLFQLYERSNNASSSDNGRWLTTALSGGGLEQGDGTIITWSIAGNGTVIDGFNNEASSPSNLVSFLEGIYGSNSPNDNDYTNEPWFDFFSDTFQRWSELSGVTYVYEANDDNSAFSASYYLDANETPVNLGIWEIRGDVRIGGHLIDGNSNILAYNFFPNISEMVIDTGDNFYNDTNNQSIKLRNVLAHEVGHGLGLEHVESSAKILMKPFINFTYDGPQFDDILGIHRLYGDYYEGFRNDTEAVNAYQNNGNQPVQPPGNDTFLNATELGLISDGETISIGTSAFDVWQEVTPSMSDFVSIDDDSDIDFYQFTIDNSADITINLTPKGPTYNQGPQGGSQSSFNAKNQNDLSLFLYNTDGTTLLNQSLNVGLGVMESITNFNLQSSGTYFIGVSGFNDAVQMYQLDVNAIYNVIIEPSGELIIGTINKDTLIGGTGDDTLQGLDNNDSLDGGLGADLLEGGNGSDTYVVDNLGDVVFENTAGTTGGIDTVKSSVDFTLPDNVENLTLTGNGIINGIGNTLNNTIIGNSQNNTLVGDNGNDNLDGKGGADTLNGGAGNDRYTIDINDTVIDSAGKDTIVANFTVDLANFSGIEFVVLSGSSNLNATGNNSANKLIGNKGSNTLIGNGGNDVIDGKLGADILDGGAGNDTYIVDNIGDTIIDSSGTDTVQSSIDWILDAGLENLLLTGSGVINGTGNSLNNTLTGNTKDNILIGGDGNDTLIGGKGNDILTGGNGADDFRFNDDIEGIDTITDFNVTEDRILVSAGKFGGGLIKNVTITESQFTLGNSATTSEQRFIYDSGSGALWFDIDGNGITSAVQFANLTSGLALSNNKIYVI